MREVVAAFSVDGRLGGRRGIGHGRFRADWTITTTPSPGPSSSEGVVEVVDWREQLRGHRGQILDILRDLP